MSFICASLFSLFLTAEKRILNKKKNLIEIERKKNYKYINFTVDITTYHCVSNVKPINDSISRQSFRGDGRNQNQCVFFLFFSA